jgi:phenylalanyl-tRNA synthetase alpha chain
MYTIDEIKVASEALAKEKGGKTPQQLLKSPVFGGLFAMLKTLPPDQKGLFGKELNALRTEVLSWATDAVQEAASSIDVTAPWATNTPTDKRPRYLDTNLGSRHPLREEIRYIADIAYRMGFTVEYSREIDDDYHMFESLNFPDGHPARDDYDTFMTDEGFVAPAHTSTMQNRYLRKYASNLERGEPIAVVVPDRVFRNEDIDVTHEHTFYQNEGIYVDKGVNVGHLVATLRTYLSEYFGQELQAKIQPFYFPFTEPSFELAIERPEMLRKTDSEADKWLELLGCGMIHPNVLRMAGIDPEAYTGFAWGCGIERLVMMKNQIEDIRHFESAKIEFLRQFS